jgi:hypothetical protein
MTIGSVARLIASLGLCGLMACSDDGSPVEVRDDSAPILTLARGNSQITTAGDELPSPIVARVTDAHNKPLAGVQLKWSADNDGTIEPERLVTDDSGLVRATWTLSTQLGRHAATATLGTQKVTFRASAIEPIPLGSPRRLQLSTYDGLGEMVHPDVVRVPRGWAPARRFLAITPYPDGNTQHELPSVYASGDPMQWDPPEGLKNPVIRPKRGYLSDPDILFEPQKNELWMYFRHVRSRNSIYLTTSPDGQHWSKPQGIIRAPNHQIVSPSVVRISATNWHMWAVNAGPIGCKSEATTVEHRTSSDGIHWTAAQKVDMSGPNDRTPWHLDVVWVPELQQFWGLYNEKPRQSCATQALRFVTSADGITWTQYPTPILRAGVVQEFRDIVYRSTMEYDARTDMVTFWYSGARSSGEDSWYWSAAVERKRRADVFRIVETPEPPRRAVVRKLPILLDAP